MDILKKVKKEYEYILFDLDGTITDPAIGITNSVIHALKKFAIKLLKHFGMDSIGVTYGYGGIEELSNAGADYIVEKPIEILEYI